MKLRYLTIFIFSFTHGVTPCFFYDCLQLAGATLQHGLAFTYGKVFAHEMGQALTARAFGANAIEVEVGANSGHTRAHFDTTEESKLTSFLIATSGPVAAIMALLAYGRICKNSETFPWLAFWTILIQSEVQYILSFKEENDGCKIAQLNSVSYSEESRMMRTCIAFGTVLGHFLSMYDDRHNNLTPKKLAATITVYCAWALAIFGEKCLPRLKFTYARKNNSLPQAAVSDE